MAETETRETPKIYVACLAAYNAGLLHGKWIDAAKDKGHIWRELRDMLASSPEAPAEEWAIHDYEGFGTLRLSEFESIEHVHELARFIEENPKLGPELLSHFSGNLDEARAACGTYLGEYTSIAACMEELTQETTQIPESLRYYIDYESMARDTVRNGDLFTIETGHEQVHVFQNR